MQGRKTLVLALTLVVLLGAGFWAWRAQARTRAVENALEASYQRAFFDLIKNMENIDTLTGKSLASGASGQRVMLLTSVWHEAERARGNLSNMPLGMVNLMRSQQYLAQLGDYCYMLAEKQARGEEISAEERQQLNQLHEQAKNTHRGLREMMAGIKEQGFQWRKMAALSQKQRLTPEARAIADGFGELDQKLQDQAPTLVYDGPFSDHVEQSAPKGLVGEEVSEAEARDIALKFMGLQDKSNFQVEKIGKARGRIPAYNISIRPEGAAAGTPLIAIDVSRKGGHIIQMINSRIPAENKISIAEAVKRAESFLREKGIEKMITTGSLRERNQLTVSFAYEQDGIVIYPDQIQVTVALDNKEVIAYNAMSFLTSHEKREIPTPKLTPEGAEEVVAKQLQIQRTRLAVIPMSNLEEKLCYEVRGHINNGNDYLVYINALTGDEEMLLQIVETENGTRTM